MLPFLHDRLSKLNGLLVHSSVVIDKYNRLDLDALHALSAWLDEAVGVYRSLQRIHIENQLLALKAQMVAAAQGTDPHTLVTVSTHRRAMQRAAALGVIQSSSGLVRDDVMRDESQLAESGQQLHPIVLLASQRSFWPGAATSPLSVAQGETLWRQCLADPDIQLGARQVALKLSHPDIILLFLELAARLR